MQSKNDSPLTHKVRWDLAGGKRGTGNQRDTPVARPDPRRLHLKGGGNSLSGTAGLVPFARYAREIGLDRTLREQFRDMKDADRTKYPMDAHCVC